LSVLVRATVLDAKPCVVVQAGSVIAILTMNFQFPHVAELTDWVLLHAINIEMLSARV
jgi:hypothetical protein